MLGLWEFLWRAGSCIFHVCVSAVWSAVPVQFYLGGVGGETVRIFLSLWLCSGGYGTVELARRGGGPFFLCFLQFAVSSLDGWMSAVGIFVLYIFCW